MRALAAAAAALAIVGAFALGQLTASPADAGPSIRMVEKRVKQLQEQVRQTKNSANLANTKLNDMPAQFSRTRQYTRDVCQVVLKEQYRSCPYPPFTAP